MKRIPSVKSVMTPFPFSVEVGDDLDAARAMMAEHRIRHLPVTDGGHVVGLFDQADLRAAEILAETSKDAGSPLVRTLCGSTPLTVDMDARLDDVVLRMADQRAGAALVVREGKLVGIVTSTDVCRFLAELLRDPFRPLAPTDVA